MTACVAAYSLFINQLMVIVLYEFEVSDKWDIYHHVVIKTKYTRSSDQSTMTGGMFKVHVGRSPTPTIEVKIFCTTTTI
jgi:hypothetical protein